MGFELIFLGTGTSAGIPMIGCDCSVCCSNDPRDHRDRASAVVRYDQRNYLIDTSPELRQGAIRHDIRHLEAVLYTHAHADHILGIDDLRRFNAVMHAALNIYGEKIVLDRLLQMFDYIFESHRNINQSFVATLVAHVIKPSEPLELGDAVWTPVRLMHGRLPIVGYRVDYQDRSLAYCTDVSEMPQETMHALRDVDVLVIDGLRDKPHPTHMTIAGAVDIAESLRAKRAFLTHLSHEHAHAELAVRLPKHIQPAYDGLVVEV